MGLFKKSVKVKSCCCSNVDNLIIKEGQDEKENSCGCGCGCDRENESKETETSSKTTEGLTLKILGSGCKNCITLAENVKKALDDMNLDATIIKVTDFAEISGYGVMSTPALVVNEKVVSYGKVLKSNEVVKILEKIIY